MSKRLSPPLWSLAAIALSALSPAIALAQAAPGDPTYASAKSQPVKDRYIVVFKSTAKDQAALSTTLEGQVRGDKGRVHHSYRGAIKGFAATIPAAALQRVRNHPDVAYVEQDATISINQTSPQNQVTWGLDRIDQASRPLDTQYNFAASGLGVNAFVIDTGIRADHTEFTGRLLAGFDAVGDGYGTNDCNGHGTHVSGTVGGTTFGVAKQVKLIPVRVLDCAGSGYNSGVIAGIDWVASSTLRPAVANMSLGGGLSQALNAAVANAVSKGVTMVVAAGNSNLDACGSSPSSEPSAITVGATTRADQRASYSNYGTCVDIFAPGSSITSAWYTGASATNTISGTSMASPHVAGAAALVLQANPTALPAAVASYLSTNATANVLSSIGTGSPNRLLYSLGTAVAPTPTVQTVAVKSMTGSAVLIRRGKGSWTASAVVTIRDLNTSAAVAKATVSATFAPGSVVSCVTGSTGSCTLKSGTFAGTVASTTLGVTGVAGTNMAYDASQNTVTQITVAKPK